MKWCRCLQSSCSLHSHMASRHRPLQQVSPSPILFSLYSTVYISFTAKTNNMKLSVLTGTSRWPWPPKPLCFTMDWLSGNPRPFTTAPVRWMSSISPLMSRPVLWSLAAGPTMASRWENEYWKRITSKLRWGICNIMYHFLNISLNIHSALLLSTHTGCSLIRISLNVFLDF